MLFICYLCVIYMLFMVNVAQHQNILARRLVFVKIHERSIFTEI